MNSSSIPSNVTHLNRDVSRDPLAREPLSLRRVNVGNPNHVSTPKFSGPGEKKGFQAKGHDRQLEDAQKSGNPIVIKLISGTDVKGVVIKRDKYTITLRQDDGSEEFFYKHAIESVQTKKPADAEA